MGKRCHRKKTKRITLVIQLVARVIKSHLPEIDFKRAALPNVSRENQRRGQHGAP